MRIIELKEQEIPSRLKNIKKPPKKIWVDGNSKILEDNAITIIGSRHNTEYGEKWCEYFTKELIRYNLVIVSGMAIGIDSIAHKTALKYGGKTIAVLPSGLKNIYPGENINLYKEIKKKGGAIISEYEPNDKASQYRFLERNRLVSGLGIATLVIEAAYRSGTSVTAGITMEHNKKVFCIPGSLDNSKSLGTNIMIKEGANIVTCVEDIIQNYPFLHKSNKKLDINLQEELTDIDIEYIEIYKAISNNPVDINFIVDKTKKGVSEVLEKITMLEITGKIKRVEGNKFVRS